MYSFPSPSKGIIVHDVIMHKRKCMKNFYSCCRRNKFLKVCTKTFSYQYKQYWSQPFPLRFKSIFHGFKYCPGLYSLANCVETLIYYFSVLFKLSLKVFHTSPAIFTSPNSFSLLRTIFFISLNLSLVLASKRVTITGCVFEALTSPQPSLNFIRTPSTSTHS